MRLARSVALCIRLVVSFWNKYHRGCLPIKPLQHPLSGLSVTGPQPGGGQWAGKPATEVVVNSYSVALIATGSQCQ